MSSRDKRSTLEERLKWLKERPALWKDVKLVPLPGGNHKLFLESADQRRIALAMRRAGLFSEFTNLVDIRVDKYVRILKGL